MLELHTVGVHAGYTEADVKAAARVFTGWNIDPGKHQFRFLADWHDSGPAKVLGWSTPGHAGKAGMADGESLLTYLARHPATARRLAQKLAIRFVADDPPAALVDAAANAYLQSDTAITPMLRVLLHPDALLQHAKPKVRRPFEALANALRVLNVNVSTEGGLGDRLHWLLDAAGQPLFESPAPNGYPDAAGAWLGASSLLERWNAAARLARGWIDGAKVDMNKLLGKPAPATAGELVNRLGARLLMRPLAPATTAAVLAFVERGAADGVERGVDHCLRAGRRRAAAVTPGGTAAMNERSVFETVTVSRRGVLKVAAAGAAGVGLPGLLPRIALSSDGAPPAGDVLVVVFLRGGMDGLTAVVPYHEAVYHDARPQVHVPANNVLNLDGRFGLHPAMASLRPLYQHGQLAIVHATGHTSETRSHFESMDAMERAAGLTSGVTSGWVARHLQTAGASGALTAAAVGTRVPASMRGYNAAALASLAAFQLAAGSEDEQIRLASALQSVHAPMAGAPLGAAAMSTLSAVDRVRSIVDKAYVPAHGVTYPSTTFGRDLQQVAQLLRAEVGVQAAAVDLGGWDTHVAMGGPEGGQMANLLRSLADGIAAFWGDLQDRAGRLTVVVMSEFGRRLQQNASGGTDHGHGNCMFVLGGGVAGGRVLGPWPGLAPAALDQGDLAVTTDFRSVLAEIVQRRLANPRIAEVFPGYTPAFLGITR